MFASYIIMVVLIVQNQIALIYAIHKTRHLVIMHIAENPR